MCTHPQKHAGDAYLKQKALAGVVVGGGGMLMNLNGLNYLFWNDPCLFKSPASLLNAVTSSLKFPRHPNNLIFQNLCPSPHPTPRLPWWLSVTGALWVRWPGQVKGLCHVPHQEIDKCLWGPENCVARAHGFHTIRQSSLDQKLLVREETPLVSSQGLPWALP